MVAEQAAGQVLDFGSDVGLRRRWFTPASYAHPAKLHLGLLAWILERYTQPGDVLLDPMAGSGSLLLATTMQRHVILRDVEPRFLALMHDNTAHILRRVGLFVGQGNIAIGAHDARQPWGLAQPVDCVLMSPPYGCQTAPTTWRRQGILPHKLRLIRSLPGHDKRWDQDLAQQPGIVGGLHFHYGDHPAQVGAFTGRRYWTAMDAVYAQAYAAIRPGGYLVLVVKDHVRHGRRVHVADETVALCERLGFVLHERHWRRVSPLSLWQRRRKERGEPVVEEEDVLCLVRP